MSHLRHTLAIANFEKSYFSFYEATNIVVCHLGTLVVKIIITAFLLTIKMAYT